MHVTVGQIFVHVHVLIIIMCVFYYLFYIKMAETFKMDYSIGLMYISIYYAPLFKREGDRAKYSSNSSITHSFLNSNVW